MARASRIQWTKGYQKELARQVKNYNARIKYAQKKYPNLVLPPKLSVKEIKKTVKTRQEYRVLIRDIERATSKTLRPNKSGISVYEERTQKLAKRRKTQSPVETSIRAKREALAKIRVDSAPGRFPTERNMILQHIGVKEGNEQNYDLIMNWMENNTTQSLQWKRNYLSAIEGVMEGLLSSGDVKGYEAYSRLRDMIERMDLEDFLMGQLLKSERVGISYVYVSKGDSIEDIANDLINQWSSIYV